MPREQEGPSTGRKEWYDDGIIARGGASPSDPDALAFIAAAGITDGTQRSALNTLVIDLKSIGIWAKCAAIYPFVGGTAGTHKYNLKDPQDTDGAFRLVFAGGLIHSATGMLPNGTTGYANTKYNAATSATLNNTHLSVYLRTNAAEDKTDIGYYDGGTGTWLVQARLAGGDFTGASYAAGGSISVANGDSRGFYLETRPSSTDHSIWKNGVEVAAQAVTAGGLASVEVLICSHQSIAGFTTREVAFASIGQGLGDVEAANYYTAVQAFQTTLGRQV